MAGVLSESSLTAALERFAALVSERTEAEHVFIAGGAAMLLQFGDGRPSTSDVDVRFKRLEQYSDFVAKVAGELDLGANWLNTKMAGYFSVQEQNQDWVLWRQIGKVTFYLASIEYLLAMKLNAGRPGKDGQDLKLLADEIGISSIEQAVAIYARYYPGEIPSERTAKLFQTLLGSSSPE